MASTEPSTVRAQDQQSQPQGGYGSSIYLAEMQFPVTEHRSSFSLCPEGLDHTTLKHELLVSCGENLTKEKWETGGNGR